MLYGSPTNPSHDRLLLSLPSTVSRDPGYQSGYVQNYNSASLCKNRKSGPGGTTTLGSTALGGSAAFVSESPTDVARTLIVEIKLG